MNDMMWLAAGIGTGFFVCMSPLIAHWMAVGIVSFVNWVSDKRQSYYTEQGHRRYESK